ncbi:hypothetical protein ABZP36_003006 [Zizania latifolia]
MRIAGFYGLTAVLLFVQYDRRGDGDEEVAEYHSQRGGDDDLAAAAAARHGRHVTSRVVITSGIVELLFPFFPPEFGSVRRAPPSVSPAPWNSRRELIHSRTASAMAAVAAAAPVVRNIKKKKSAAMASKPRKQEKMYGMTMATVLYHVRLESDFRAQLDSQGLKIIQVSADGNCFFRAMADQLDGNEEEHTKYRAMVVQYIKEHRVDFEPFIEYDVPFEEYCDAMQKNKTWAGHMELQAASLLTGRNICIHTLNSPRLYINNFSGPEATTSMIHLSYHRGEHYNSVRLREDPCQGPAMPVVVRASRCRSCTGWLRRFTGVTVRSYCIWGGALAVLLLALLSALCY